MFWAVLTRGSYVATKYSLVTSDESGSLDQPCISTFPCAVE